MIINWLIGFMEWSGYLWTIGLAAVAVLAILYVPKVGTHIALICLMAGSGTYLMRDAYSRGEAVSDARWEAKAETEAKRRDKVLADLQRETAEVRIAYESERQANERIQRDIALHLPADVPGPGGQRVCLDPDTLRRLQEFRRR